MAYVGTPIDTTNQFQSLVGKRFSGDGSTTAFTLDIAPSSVFDIEVFVENVRQDPNSAYSLSGTTLTLAAAPASGTNNIYVVHQAKAVGTISPAAGTVNADSFDNTVISGHTALAATPADTDEFLISDAGTIKRIDYSHIKGLVRQVLHTDTTTQVTTTSATFAQYTQLNRTITPTSTSSKILVQVSLSFFLLGSNYNDAGFQITQGGTSIANYGFAGYKPDSTSALAFSPVFLQTLHSPSSTSELTYGVKYNQPQGSETLVLTYQGSSTGEQQRSSITVMEILG